MVDDNRAEVKEENDLDDREEFHIDNYQEDVIDEIRLRDDDEHSKSR
jgi:hypothetical protein